MDEHDPLIERLGDLGRQPVDPATASLHLTEMDAVGHGRRRSWTRVKVGAALGVGLVLGGTGLASAGALPTTAQDAAHKTLSKVGLAVPQGTERFVDPAVCGTDPSTQQPFRNHGQYVKAHRGDPAAAQSRCGKPLQAGQSTDKAVDEPPAKPDDPNADKGKGGNGSSGPSQGKGGNGQTPGGNGRGNNGNHGQDKVHKDEAADETTDPAESPGSPAPGKSGRHGHDGGPTESSSSTSTSTTSTTAHP